MRLQSEDGAHVHFEVEKNGMSQANDSANEKEMH